MSIYRIIYSSEVSDSVSMETIEDILKVAQARNSELGVTGVLLCDGFKFVQVLEGHTENVKTLLKSISQDPRHQNVEVIAQSEIDVRQFSGWSMGFVDTGAVLADFIQSTIGHSSSDLNLNKIIDDLRKNPENIDLFTEKCLDALKIKTKPKTLFGYLASIIRS